MGRLALAITVLLATTCTALGAVGYDQTLPLESGEEIRVVRPVDHVRLVTSCTVAGYALTPVEAQRLATMLGDAAAP